MNTPKETVTCPICVEGEEIGGCGSSNVRFDAAENVWDCLDCGIWFKVEVAR